MAVVVCVCMCLALFTAHRPGAVLGENIWGAWPFIIWEATTANRNYYRTNDIKHVENLGLNYPEKIWEGAWARIGGLCPLAPT